MAGNSMGNKNVAELESQLYGRTLDDRLAALRELCATAEKKPRQGVDLHLHTNESFSVFRSPTEAVWQAVCEGVAVLGINDHYTCAGHDEFRQACAIAHLPATFSMEGVAMDRDAEAAGELTNDPGNPGRTYLCAKGVTRIPLDDSPAMQALMTMRAALEARNREMTEKVRAVFKAEMGEEGPTWDDVASLAPHGNTTERHVSKAVFLRLEELAGPAASEAVAQLCGDDPPGEDDASLQNFIRARLLKAGCPCFVEEAPEAFLDIEPMRDMFLGFGGIPTYPVLGNPITEREEDIEALLDRMESIDIYALEVIPQRNTRERLAEIVNAARKRNWPVFNGTEHNTPVPAPLLVPLALDPEFLPWFEQSAALLLGHHRLVEQGELGFVGADGTPSIPDALERFERFSRAGREVWEKIAGAAGDSSGARLPN